MAHRASFTALFSALVFVALLSACESPVSSAYAGADAGQESGDEPADTHEAVCCGCLCVDSSWSCAQDTCVDSQGHVHDLAAEAGFLEVPIIVQRGWDTIANDQAARISARMWYAFRPADEDPEHKPLVVLMQGGPGSSVLPLWGGNTGPLTLDARRGAEVASENPVRWTRFANLLYVDTPWAGFSYQRAHDGLAPVPRTLCERAFDPDEEAASYVRTVLRFLARHPELRAAPVALLGESYGGVRVTLMLQQLLRSERLRAANHNYRDPELADEIAAHWAATGQRAERGSRQFFAQILIQPGWVELRTLIAADPKRCDWSPFASQSELEFSLIEAMSAKLSAPVLSLFTGVDVTTIQWLQAGSRGDACPRLRGGSRDLPLSADLGALAPDDMYNVRSAPVRTAFHFPRRDKEGELAGYPLAHVAVENLRQVETFITNARCDDIIDGEATLRALGQLEAAGVTRSESMVEQGRALVELADGSARTLHFPRYPDSGHIVSLHAPEQLARDVERFLLETLPSGE